MTGSYHLLFIPGSFVYLMICFIVSLVSCYFGLFLVVSGWDWNPIFGCYSRFSVFAHPLPPPPPPCSKKPETKKTTNITGNKQETRDIMNKLSINTPNNQNEQEMKTSGCRINPEMIKCHAQKIVIPFAFFLIFLLLFPFHLILFSFYVGFSPQMCPWWKIVDKDPSWGEDVQDCLPREKLLLPPRVSHFPPEGWLVGWYCCIILALAR